MERLLALLLLVPSLCLSQIPDYVPTDGLVAWYPFNGNANDESGNGHHGEVQGAVLTLDRNGNENSAYEFDGAARIAIPSEAAPVQSNARTMNVFFISHSPIPTGSATWNNQVVIGCGSTAGGPVISLLTIEGDHDGKLSTQTGSWQNMLFSNAPVQDSLWHMATLTYAGPNSPLKLYLDGELQGETNPIWLSTHSSPLYIGDAPWATLFFDGLIDDVAIWDHALSGDQIEALYLAAPPIYGCTIPAACNFNDEATWNDDTCEFGCLNCGAGTVWNDSLSQCIPAAEVCGNGTVWDSTLAQCISTAPPCATSCGDGTVWDPINEECIIAIPADLNFDGCVTINDLLVLLNVHGTCPPYPEWPDEPTDTSWACGDPLTYWDFDYATVLIGDQCWFAENLRTEQYANSDSISANLTDGEWTSTTTGATSVFGEGSSSCYHSSPDIDACDEVQSLAEYGRVYNWYAVDDSRGICPSGWHAPTDEEWFELEDYITSQGFDGTEGTALKSTTGWNNGGNGTDDFGFSGIPGGYRTWTGYFSDAGYNGYWWSSSPNEGYAWYRYLNSVNPDIGRPNDYPQAGFSVRCVKD